MAEYFLNDLPADMVIEEVSDEARGLGEAVALANTRRIDVGMDFN